jgi:hypothetical protein
MARNKSEEKVAKKADSNPEQPYDVELNLMKSAHVAFLEKAWKVIGDPVFVRAMMHTIHYAMMEDEFNFLFKESEKKVHGQKRDT